jgi:L,D-transpeptidase YcbB
MARPANTARGARRKTFGMSNSMSLSVIARVASAVALLGLGAALPAFAQATRNDLAIAPAQVVDEGNTNDAFKQRREENARKEDILLEAMLTKHMLVSPEAEQGLAAAVQRYQQIVSGGGWPVLPKTRTLRVGDSDEVIPLLRVRLQLTDGLNPENQSSWTLDEEVQAALMAFQNRHGIPPNGVLDRRTFAALNVSAMTRLEQLRVNQLRVREMLDRGMPQRYVLVNVPGFELQAVNQGQVELSSRVIAGRPERQTPATAAKIQGLNFYPFWNVPESVAFKDLVPRAQKDPSFLVNERIRVLSAVTSEEIDPRNVDWGAPEFLNIRFKQDPGPQNALGLVRIDMPNPDNVYMHDTPMKPLFGRSSRAFSAGCVRVHRIFDLVTWIAATNGDWDCARVTSVLDGGQPFDVKLTVPIDVFFVYISAWADPGGQPQFRQDLYGRDGATTVAIADRDDREGAPPPQSLAP